MGSGKRRRRIVGARRERAEWNARGGYVTRVGVLGSGWSEGDRSEVAWRLHDLVIDEVDSDPGRRRVGPVAWSFDVWPRGASTLSRLVSGGEISADVVELLRVASEDEGSLVVVAWVPVVPVEVAS